LLTTPTNVNGLKKDSIIRLIKVASLDSEFALGLLGRLDGKYHHDLDNILKLVFKLK
jgi:mRNA interferase MazF